MQSTPSHPFHDLASATSGNRQQALLSAVASLIALTPATAGEDLRRMAALAQALFPKANEGDRIKLAQAIARRCDIAHDFIREVALSAGAIARPVLSFSPLLKDTDLRDAFRTDETAREAIAARGDLSDEIVALLAEHGGARVHAVLMANPAVSLPVSMLGRFWAEAQVGDIAGRLMLRHGSNPELASAYFMAMPSLVRRSLLRHLAEAVTLTISDATTLLARVPGAVDDQMNLLAAKGSRADIVAAFIELLHLQEAESWTILNDMSGEPMLIAARALGLRNQTVARLLVRGPAVIAGDSATLVDLIDLYEELSAPVAIRVIAAIRDNAQTEATLAGTGRRERPAMDTRNTRQEQTGVPAGSAIPTLRQGDAQN